MSIESPKQASPLDQGDVDTALELIEESSVFNNKPDLKNVAIDMVKRGYDSKGEPITDVGNFIAGFEDHAKEDKVVAETTEKDRKDALAKGSKTWVEKRGGTD